MEKGIIISSQLSVAKWGELITNPAPTAGFMARLTANEECLKIKVSCLEEKSKLII